jgi:hypothetical protein
MPRGRPGRTPKQVKQTKEKPAGHQGLGNHGNLPGPGPGRPKASRNKFSGELKVLILEALANAHAKKGDAVDYLIEQARQANPSPFMGLVGKCITQETKNEGTLQVSVNLRKVT